MSQSVVWPAFIKYSGDDELAYINDQAQWLSDADYSSGYFEAADRLVDSQGQVFTLPTGKNQRVCPELTGQQVSETELADWLRRHYSVTGACCVSKINLESLSDCMAMLSDSQNS